jgi:type III secretion protein HrpB1
MNPHLHSKEFVTGLIDVISQGISHNQLEDAEAVLACVRALRPKLAELDTFDAWIAIKRGFWHDAVRTLRNVDAASPNWALGRALLAFCQFALGDAEWTLNANEVMTSSENNDAIGLVKLLLGEDNAVPAHEEAGAGNASAGVREAMATSAYMRA